MAQYGSGMRGLSGYKFSEICFLHHLRQGATCLERFQACCLLVKCEEPGEQ